MIVWLLNIAAICFFISTLIGLHRKWRARERMDSTSLEGTIIHLVGNVLISVSCLLLGAYVAAVAEAILSVIAAVTVFWKVKWLLERC